MNIKVQKNVIYDEINKSALDIYEPDNTNGYGIMVIHGGGWFHGDKEKDEDWAQLFAGAGYLTIVPNYRLAPDHLFPAARDDIFTAFDWFQSKHNLKGIGIAGSSSGGNLAIELGLVKGIPTVSWSGIIDLDSWINQHPEVIPQKDTKQDFTHLASSQIDQAGPDDSFYKWFVLNYVGHDSVKLKEASLLHRVKESAGPMLLINSMNELSPTDAVIRLEEKLLAAGISVMTKFIPGGRHAKGYLAEAQPYTLAFFNEYLSEQGQAWPLSRPIVVC